ncbi:MAG: SpoIID/LytB domain-containing protein, partial [Gemmatimonadales bacterium]|nr:SpoIID/LytB domain-containing protein [Gemmatimonadales bacterium]
HLVVAALLAAAAGSCIRQENPPSEPEPRQQPSPTGRPQPNVRVGLAVGASSLAIGGVSALRITEPDGAVIAQVPAGEVWRIVLSGRALSAVSPGGWTSPATETMTIAPRDSGDLVHAGRRDYRGTLDAVRDRTGLTLINRVSLEQYIQGVIGGEMGRRDSSEVEALRAQAVVSRTYALRNLGRWRAQGFDFYATVADQVYLGVTSENALSREAVLETQGEVITLGGAPIDAFFFSTCGGRTATGTEAFHGANRSYLQSIADVGPGGAAWCSISPRFHWREEWEGDALRALLQRTLPAAGLIAANRVGRILDVGASGRTTSGRVERLAVATSGGSVLVDGPRIRATLRSTSGDILRSTAFDLSVSRRNGQVSRLVIDGRGAGHGVGMCQWGAVGRARAGQRYPEILSAYFPGTQIERYY